MRLCGTGAESVDKKILSKNHSFSEFVFRWLDPLSRGFSRTHLKDKKKIEKQNKTFNKSYCSYMYICYTTICLKLSLQLWHSIQQNLWHANWPYKEITGPRQANLVLIAYASSEGSGEPAHPRSLARTFALTHTSSESRGTFRQKARSLWLAGNAQLKFVMTECSKTQIRLTGLNG